MATTITQSNSVTVITLGLTGIATKVIPPRFTRFLHLQFRNAIGGVAYTGTDGATISPDYFNLAADQLVELQHDGDRPFYLAGASDAVEAVVVCREW